MRRFDYSFLNNGLLPANLVNLTSNIAALKTMAGVRKEEYTQIFTELEAVAKVQSIKSSNAIEGIVTSDERIAAIVNQNSTPLNHNEAEIAGYRDALNEIHLGYRAVSLLPFLCFFDKELLFAAHLRQENICMIVFGQGASQNTLRWGRTCAILGA